MKTPQKDTIVYSRHGSRAKFVAEVDGKYFVTPEIEYQKYDGDVEYDWGDTTAWNEIFAKPPTEVLHGEVVRLEGEVNHKLEELNELREKIRESERAIAAQKQKFARYEKLKYLEDYIDGKITHFVVTGKYYYGNGNRIGFDIVPFSEGIKYKDDYRREKLKLLTLHGDSKGNLQWDIGEYSNYNGVGVIVIPCRSYEEALAEAQKIINEKAEELIKEGKLNYDCYEDAVRFGLNVPQVIIDYKEKQRAEYEKNQLEWAEEALEQAKKKLEKIKAGDFDGAPFPPKLKKV